MRVARRDEVLLQVAVESGLIPDSTRRAILAEIEGGSPQKAPQILLRLGLATGRDLSRVLPEVEWRTSATRLLTRYRIDRQLGKGAAGTVYDAFDLQMGRPVALKVLSGPVARSRTCRRRFLREIRAVARLNHPNVIRVYDAGEERSMLYLLMERVDGPTLRERIEGEPGARTALPVLLEQAARGMHHAHEKGIVHRDLKPSNILTTPDGLAKVADFGLVRLTDSKTSTLLTQPHALVGTPAYMAPEQIDGRWEDVTPAADVWALGAILYEVLAGRRPFDASSAVELFHQVLTTQPPPPHRIASHDVPPALEALAMRALSRPRSSRPGALEFADLLAAARAAGERPSARQARAPTTTRRSRGSSARTAPARRRPGRLAAAGLAGAVAGAGVIAALVATPGEIAPPAEPPPESRPLDDLLGPPPPPEDDAAARARAARAILSALEVHDLAAIDAALDSIGGAGEAGRLDLRTVASRLEKTRRRMWAALRRGDHDEALGFWDRLAFDRPERAALAAADPALTADYDYERERRPAVLAGKLAEGLARHYAPLAGTEPTGVGLWLKGETGPVAHELRRADPGEGIEVRKLGEGEASFRSFDPMAELDTGEVARIYLGDSAEEDPELLLLLGLVLGDDRGASPALPRLAYWARLAREGDDLAERVRAVFGPGVSLLDSDGELLDLAVELTFDDPSALEETFRIPHPAVVEDGSLRLPYSEDDLRLEFQGLWQGEFEIEARASAGRFDLGAEFGFASLSSSLLDATGVWAGFSQSDEGNRLGFGPFPAPGDRPAPTDPSMPEEDIAFTIRLSTADGVRRLTLEDSNQPLEISGAQAAPATCRIAIAWRLSEVRLERLRLEGRLLAASLPGR